MPNSILFHKVYSHPDSHEWVVFIHGAGGSSSIWFKQVKEYREHFNLVLIDLRGHGRSSKLIRDWLDKRYTFSSVTQDVLAVLDYLGIGSAHFVGMSLGTIIVRNIAELAASRVKTMVLGGAVTRLNIRSRIMVLLGHMSKHVIPYMWLYRLFALIIMPQVNQRESRNLFVREASRLCQKEFKRWFSLTVEVNPLMTYFREKDTLIPTLYVMGELDYMFIKPVKDMVAEHRWSELCLIPDCGHVCNVERPELFNRHSIGFIKRHQ